MNVGQSFCLIHQKIKSVTGESAVMVEDLAFREFVPHQNPCAQCGRPIMAPAWIEAGSRKMSYLWVCSACNYRFAAVAFFEGGQSEPAERAA